MASFVAFPCDGPLASFVTFLCGPCCPTSFAVLQIAIVVAWLITRKISKSVIGGFVRYVFASLDSLSRNAGADSTTTNRSRTTDHGPRTRTMNNLSHHSLLCAMFTPVRSFSPTDFWR